MAEKLGWPNVNVTWTQIAGILSIVTVMTSALATDPSGWATIGGSWGSFKYGHGHPQ